MPSRATSILYVRLPCWKIYPGGMIYVADHVHRHRPSVHQEILDLALIPKSERRGVLKTRLLESRPDVVAFSWRNMQVFGPHPENDALDVVMNFDYSSSILSRAGSAWDALSIIKDYAESRISNFRFMRDVRALVPDARIVVGGTAVSIFGRYIARKCPTNSIVVVGEGEDAMLSIVDGAQTPIGESWHKDPQGNVSHSCRDAPFALEGLGAVDFEYIASIFPEFHEYRDDFIGVQTKRGCPYQCHFCLYNTIEGRRQRYRDPQEVASEVEDLEKTYGSRNIWFTDAQFFSTRRSTAHAEAVLTELIRRRVQIRWAGYLRFDHLSPVLARKMFESGLCSIDTTFAGSQEIVSAMTLGYSLERQMGAFRLLRESGYTDQPVKLYIPLNCPGETVDTLRQTITRISELYHIFGRDNVLPFIFFVGIQPGTPVERLLIEQGYLKKDYDPLTLNPFAIKRLLYNPPPLGAMIGRAYLDAVEATRDGSDYVGRVAMDNIARIVGARRAGPSHARLQIPFTRRTGPSPHSR